MKISKPTTKLILLAISVYLIFDITLGTIYTIVQEKNILKQKNQKVLESKNSEDEKTTQKLRIQSPIYHHDFSPNMVSQEFWGSIPYTIHTNSLGFRDVDKKEIPLPSKNYRLLFIGDSFLEGNGVAYELTCTGIIQKQLEPLNIDVLNASVSSYSPIIYYKKVEYLIETLGLEFDELIVFIDTGDINDEGEVYKLNEDGHVIMSPGQKTQNQKIGEIIPASKSHQLSSFERHSITARITARTIKTMIKRLNRKGKENRQYGLNQRRALWTVDSNTFNEYAVHGLNQAEEHMNLLVALLNKHDIKLQIAIYPWPDQIYHNDLESKQVSFWKKWAGEHNVTLINFFPDFINGDNWKNVVSRHFIPRDFHWNENGHQLIAKRFLEHWLENKPTNQNH